MHMAWITGLSVLNQFDRVLDKQSCQLSNMIGDAWTLGASKCVAYIHLSPTRHNSTYFFPQLNQHYSEASHASLRYMIPNRINNTAPPSVTRTWWLTLDRPRAMRIGSLTMLYRYLRGYPASTNNCYGSTQAMSDYSSQCNDVDILDEEVRRQHKRHHDPINRVNISLT
jgi:hypothetical protein